MSTATPTTAERIGEQIADAFMGYLPPKRRHVRNIVRNIALDIISRELERERQQVREAIQAFFDHRSAVFDAQIRGVPLPDGIEDIINNLRAALAMLEPSREGK